jgi:hypothetical protein
LVGGPGDSSKTANIGGVAAKVNRPKLLTGNEVTPIEGRKCRIPVGE